MPDVTYRLRLKQEINYQLENNQTRGKEPSRPNTVELRIDVPKAPGKIKTGTTTPFSNMTKKGGTRAEQPTKQSG